MLKNCFNPKCKNTFPIDNPKKKFCCVNCKSRYNFERYYNKKKDTPEFKKRQKGYFNKWLSKNRKHFNEMCLVNEQKYLNRIRKERKKLGLCYRCGNKIEKERKIKKLTRCVNCSNYEKQRRLDGKQ